jgi:hypothetical protein
MPICRSSNIVFDSKNIGQFSGRFWRRRNLEFTKSGEAVIFYPPRRGTTDQADLQLVAYACMQNLTKLGVEHNCEVHRKRGISH